MRVVNVAVGVIKRGQKIFISKRSDDLHQGGLWEFPGGKIEDDETPEQATCRELREEVGIIVRQQEHLMLIEHDYGDKQVKLHISLIEDFTNEPEGKEGQITQWINIKDLHTLAFPAANTPIIKTIQSRFP